VKSVLVVYYSKAGKTKRMAENICEAVNALKVQAVLKGVESFNVTDLVKFDGIAVGSPTYFSNMAWPIKKLVDESIYFYGATSSLEGKVGGCFTSAGCQTDGIECLRLLELSFGFHHKMKLVPGIISNEDEKEDELKQRCRDFGARLAGRLTQA